VDRGTGQHTHRFDALAAQYLVQGQVAREVHPGARLATGRKPRQQLPVSKCQFPDVTRER
jgi:hypothetical protein